MEARTKHFWRTLPPSSFLAVNRREWEEMHDRLNGGVPVPKEQTKTLRFAVGSSAFRFVSYLCQPSVDILQFWVGQDVQFGSGAAAALLLRRDPRLVLSRCHWQWLAQVPLTSELAQLVLSYPWIYLLHDGCQDWCFPCDSGFLCVR